MMMMQACSHRGPMSMPLSKCLTQSQPTQTLSSSHPYPVIVHGTSGNLTVYSGLGSQDALYQQIQNDRSLGYCNFGYYVNPKSHQFALTTASSGSAPTDVYRGAPSIQKVTSPQSPASTAEPFSTQLYDTKISSSSVSSPPQHREIEINCPDKSMSNLTNVWDYNFKEEFTKLDYLIWFGKFTHVGLDTEFPGFIFSNPDPNYIYKTIKENVDCMNVIQIGITLFDYKGNLCSGKGTHTWQFNLKFDMEIDNYSAESLVFLGKHGIDLDMHKKCGINLREFANYFMCSGLVANPNVKFITFHGAYDAAYLVKLICGSELPNSELEFFKVLRKYIPCICDIRLLVLRFKGDFVGGLESLAGFLNVLRVGQKHNGGSDACVTGKSFFVLKKLLEHYDDLAVNDSDFDGKFWRMSKSFSDIDCDSESGRNRA